LRIVLVSGHRKNWDAGASTVYLHLDECLRRLGEQSVLLHQEDYLPPGTRDVVAKVSAPAHVARRALAETDGADVVDVAGNLGWRLFRALKARPTAERPLCVMRIHGLEFKDEQARIDEEIAQQMRLSRKYRLLTRHWLNWQEFESLRLADIVICHSSREVDAIVTAGLKPEGAVHLVPLGVDAEYLMDRNDYPPAGERLLWWGSWVERKGISALPRAFQIALRERPTLTLSLGGTGWKEGDLLREFAPEVRDRVKVLPFVTREEHKSLLLSHDVFVFPSLSEGFGLALLEAMATGMPAVTTFTGMAHDWLEHGRNCLLVPMSGPTALAREIIRLAGDAALRTRIGAAARETARALTWEEFGRRSREVYGREASAMRRSPQRPEARTAPGT